MTQTVSGRSMLRYAALVAIGVTVAVMPAGIRECTAGPAEEGPKDDLRMPEGDSPIFAARKLGQSPRSAKAVSVEVQNPSRQRLRDVPVSFGQVFRRGDIDGGVAVSIGGRSVPAQIDVKRHHDDRSVRFAAISTVVDELPAGGKVVLDLADAVPAGLQKAAVSPSDLLGTAFDAVVTLNFPDGAARSLSARKLLEQAGHRARRGGRPKTLRLAFAAGLGHIVAGDLTQSTWDFSRGTLTRQPCYRLPRPRWRLADPVTRFFNTRGGLS